MFVIHFEVRKYETSIFFFSFPRMFLYSESFEITYEFYIFSIFTLNAIKILIFITLVLWFTLGSMIILTILSSRPETWDIFPFMWFFFFFWFLKQSLVIFSVQVFHLFISKYFYSSDSPIIRIVLFRSIIVSVQKHSGFVCVDFESSNSA